MHIGVMTNIHKMQSHRIFDADFLGIDTKGTHQFPGILVGTV